jgi:hypothetical protein
MSRWNREVLICCASPLFWLTLHVMRLVTTPFTHCLAFLQKPIAHYAKFEEGAHLCQLVSGKGDQIFTEFTGILLDSDWCACVGIVPAGSALREDVVPMLLELCLHHAAAFYRRIVLPLHEYPLALFLLVAKPHDIACDKRQRLSD